MEPEVSLPYSQESATVRVLSQTNPVHKHPPHLFENHVIFSFHLRIGLKVFLRAFQSEFCKHFCYLPCMLHTGLLLDFHWFDQPNNIWRGARSIKLLIILLSKSSHSLHFMFRYAHYPAFTPPQNYIPLSPPEIKNPVHTKQGIQRLDWDKDICVIKR
jgi:hypothetical protein